MLIKEISQYPRLTVEQLLTTIPFYRAVLQADPWQFDVLLAHSRFAFFAPGEVVLNQGDTDRWVFFLLKGQLDVLVDASAGDKVVNHITPGEVFGDLAMVQNGARTATVRASPGSREVMVFGTDFAVFGELEQLHPVGLGTKLAYYRNMVHNLRWKLEVYRGQYPHHELASLHRQVRLYTGSKESLAELQALHRQAVELGQLLIAWNAEFGRVADTRFFPDQRLLAGFTA